MNIFLNLGMEKTTKFSVFVDTNILFSATLDIEIANFLINSLIPNCNVITSDDIVDELEVLLYQNLEQKKYRSVLKRFKQYMFPLITVLPAPEVECEQEEAITDAKGKRILRAAIAADAVLLTADQHFLDARDRIEEILIVNISEFDVSKIKKEIRERRKGKQENTVRAIFLPKFVQNKLRVTPYDDVPIVIEAGKVKLKHPAV